MIIPFIQGFGTGGGLIVAIGAQNAFVLSQGVRRNHHFIIALICIVCDGVFISAGVAGFGTAVSTNPTLSQLVAWGGAGFLFFYGAVSASTLWFISLSLGGQMLAPLFKKQISWRILDSVVCATMWTIAVLLIIDKTSV